MQRIPFVVASLLASAMNNVAWANTGEPAERDATVIQSPVKKTFSTGVAKGRDLLDTAISASVIDEADLSKLSVMSIAGIMQNIPGIRAETSDIDGYSAITVRGLPLSSDGSKYLQLQEDGLPVLEFGDINRALADSFIRADLSLAQVQAIRGGSASTFASNSPGGVVNFISKTGETEGGAIQISSGLGHDLKRLDFDYGSSLGEGWRFHVGGFYRQGEGPRTIGYDAFEGGQLKVNVTRQFANGYIRIYGKYLDDRQPNYARYPVLVTGTDSNPVIQDIAGNNVRRDAFASLGTSIYPSMDNNNQPRLVSDADGITAKVKSVGLEAQFEIAGWTVSNRFRFSDISGANVEYLPMVNGTPQAVATIVGGPGSRLVYSGGPFAGQNMTTGIAAITLAIRSDINELDNTTNDLRASRVWNVGSGKLTTTFGLYLSSQDVDYSYSLVSHLRSVRGDGQMNFLDAINSAGTTVTENGIYAYGFGLGIPASNARRRTDLNFRTLAPYGSFNYQFGKIALGGSLRYDRGSVAGQIISGQHLGRLSVAAIDVNGNGTVSPVEQRVPVLPLGNPLPVKYDYDYISYSGGVNYRFSPVASAFARYSRGARAGADRVLEPGGFNLNTGLLTNPADAFGYVRQAEAGLKLRTDGLAAYVTGFWASTRERNSQVQQNTLLIIDREYSAKGVELEAEFVRGPLKLTLGGTYTAATIDRDLGNPANNGNRPRHIPKISYQARPEFNSGIVSLGTVINGATSSFAQDTNLLKQPGYVLISPFLQLTPVAGLRLGLNAFNVFNKLALVQLGSATIPPNGLVNAQVMNGRTITGSIRYSF